MQRYGPAVRIFLNLWRAFGLIRALMMLLGTAAIAFPVGGYTSKWDVLVMVALVPALTIAQLALINGWQKLWIGQPAGTGGSSRFMRPHELLRRRWRHGAIYLGVTQRTATLGRFAIGQEDDRHAVTIAANRSGKSRSLVLNNLHLWEGAVLVTDPKGELCLATWRFRQAMGHQVAAIDPYGVLAKAHGKKPLGIEVGYNVLLDIDRRAPDIDEQIDTVMSAIVVDEGDKNIHWTEGSKQLLKAVTALVLIAMPPEKRNLAMVRYLLLRRDRLNELLQEAKTLASSLPYLWQTLEAGFAQLDTAAPNIIDQWATTAGRNMNWLGTAPVANAVSTSVKRSLRDLKGGKVTIYLVLPADKLLLQGRLLRVFVQQALVATMTTPGEPVLLLLDEFIQLGFLKEIEQALGIAAGLGVKLWIIIQDIPQLKRVYPASWESFLGAAGSVSVFGVQDQETAEVISRMCGTKQRRQWEDGDIAQPTPHSVPLLTPDEVRRTLKRDGNRMLVFFHGEHPALLRRINCDSRFFQRFVKARSMRKS